MEKERFEQIVEEALAGIPAKFRKLLRNIAVMVEDRPPHGQPLLGIYHGVPYQHRGPYYGNNPPDVIVLYREPIESLCRTEEEVREKIREVVLHEVGHYFGMDEGQLRRIEGEKFRRTGAREWSRRFRGSQ